MKIYADILAVRILLDKIEEKMKAGIYPAEKRLGIEAVLTCFLALSKAQEALRELDVAVRPPIEDTPPLDDWLKANGYM
jgi:hypothetical protein